MYIFLWAVFFFFFFFKENIPINEFLWKTNQICIIFTYKRSVQKSNIFRKIPEIADDHNFETECAKDMKFVSKCVVLDTLLYSTNNSIRPKVDLGPIGNELFI